MQKNEVHKYIHPNHLVRIITTYGLVKIQRTNIFSVHLKRKRKVDPQKCVALISLGPELKIRFTLTSTRLRFTFH